MDSVVLDTIIMNQECKKVVSYYPQWEIPQYHSYDDNGDHIGFDLNGNSGAIMKNKIDVGMNWSFPTTIINSMGDTTIYNYNMECTDKFPNYQLKDSSYIDVVKIRVSFTFNNIVSNIVLNNFYARGVGLIESRHYENDIMYLSRSLLSYQLE